VVARPYNPVSAESGSDIQICVKRYPDSKMGTKLHNLKVGETVEVRGPNKQWSYESGKYTHIAMVAGGTGITPLVQATEYILLHGTEVVTVVTFNNSSEDVLLREQLARLAATFPRRLTVTHVVEANVSKDTVQGSATDPKALLKKLLPVPGHGVLVMVCGRKEMTAAIAGPKTPDFKQGDVGGVLKDMGYSTEQVWKV